MTPTIHLCLVLHQHQPVGNFDSVNERAYQQCYRPLLDTLQQHDSLSLSLHTSGPLMLWLADHHPEYIERLRRLAASGRIEILGGPQYEPILTLLPRRDRIGQLLAYSTWLHRHLDIRVTGMWTPERVWEQPLAADIAAAGLSYTVLDDHHFLAAGVDPKRLTGYFLTEHDGAVLRVFPGSQQLRRLIPAADPQETIDHCWQLAQQQPGTVLTLADDAEKFGLWPGAGQHVFDQGWLQSLCQALVDNANWLRSSTLAEVVQSTRPGGRIQLSEGSYPEAASWPLPIERQRVLDRLVADIAQSDQESASGFIRGGNWRSFRIKYSEAGELYGFMKYVSDRLRLAEDAGADRAALTLARDHLYRGQCGCPYWHGLFGGVYLPHLRLAAYQQLIRADAELDAALASVGQGHRPGTPLAEALADDFDFDLMQEVRLANEHFTLWAAPGRGGRLYQWDVRRSGHNLLATMQRRPEAYHDAAYHDALQSTSPQSRRPAYDRFAPKSMLDHFFDLDVGIDQVAEGTWFERGDFVEQPFEAKLRRGSDRVQLQMRRDGVAWGMPVTITKAVTLVAGQQTATITYLLENLPPDRDLHFGVRWNLAGLDWQGCPPQIADHHGQSLGSLAEPLDIADLAKLKLLAPGCGLQLELQLDRPAGVWAFPVETLSRAPEGLERIRQSVCVLPHWVVRGDDRGRWALRLNWHLQPLQEEAEQRLPHDRDLQIVS